MQQQNQSEVAAMLHIIDLETEAGRRALYDPAIVAPHEFIERHATNAAHTQIQIFAFDRDLVQHVEDSIRNGDFEMDQRTVELFQERVMSHLQGIQDELAHMEPLPDAGTDEAIAIHDTWMKAQDCKSDLVHQAEQYALWLIPDEITAKLNEIRELAWGKVQLTAATQEQGKDK